MTVPSDEHERTLAFAEIALQQIKALRQPASPRNFEIWYQYATGYTPELNRSINEMLAQHGTLSDADIDQIYRSYISPTRVGDRLDTLGTRMVGEIKEVIDMIDTAAGSATSYSASLADASEKLCKAPASSCRATRAWRCAPSSSGSSPAPRRWRPATKSSKRGCRRRGRRSSSCSKISRPYATKASPIR
jgi:diguanylate cyclase